MNDKILIISPHMDDEVLAKIADPSQIGKVCKGKRKTAGGFKWQYNNSI